MTEKKRRMIRDARPSDAAAICHIYNYFVENTVVTFEEEPVTESGMRGRIEEITRVLPWLVLEEQGRLRGYAYATPWKSRSAYRFAAESTVYLAPDAIGQGHGRRLYEALLDRLTGLNIHSVMGGIALPNPASVALHEKLGFRKVAHFREVGWKMDRWIDVGYWELILSSPPFGDETEKSLSFGDR